MSFHYSNFGAAGTELQPLADLRGYVPEEGDEPDQFEWSHDEYLNDYNDDGDGYDGFAADMWREHVTACVAATRRAEQEVAKWRKEGS